MDIVNLYDDFGDYEIYDAVQLRTRRIRSRQNYEWSNEEFFQRFRFRRETVMQISEIITPQICRKTDRNNALTPHEQLLVALRYYATSSFYIVQGDFAGIHKSTVNRIIHDVSNALANLCPVYIKMPENIAEIKKKQQEFHNISRFPRVIGALDGTLIKIQSPGGPTAENYRCRKGYFALNVQALCDANYKFTNIVARWAGSTHDSTIFNNSGIKFQFERGDYANAVILGDAGYPLKKYLMTPIANPQTEPEALYNEAHVRTRNVIERTFGIWKRRFPAVGIGMRCQIPLAQKIIVATAVLHNFAREESIKFKNALEFDNEIIIEQSDENNLQHVNYRSNENERARKQFVEYFANL